MRVDWFKLYFYFLFSVVSFSRQFALFWICVFRISDGMDENYYE
jgi:hypothetical protein